MEEKTVYSFGVLLDEIYQKSDMTRFVESMSEVNGMMGFNIEPGNPWISVLFETENDAKIGKNHIMQFGFHPSDNIIEGSVSMQEYLEQSCQMVPLGKREIRKIKNAKSI